jgi:predicted nucleic acid-binding protein
VANVRKIQLLAGSRQYYVVDSNFLANKFIPTAAAPVGRERERVQACQDWWDQIEIQLVNRAARVYVPDICIAEAFKILARKRYQDHWLTTVTYNKAKKALSSFVRSEPRTLRSYNRNIRVHDISTNRDIIVSVDRFFELFFKRRKYVQIADLILASTAKYLMDFYDIPKAALHIVTTDAPLREGIAKSSDLPPAYDPTLKGHRAAVVFAR